MQPLVPSIIKFENNKGARSYNDSLQVLHTGNNGKTIPKFGE